MKKREACGMLIKQINDQLEKDANNALRSEDLTMIQVSILLELEQREDETASMKDVERFLGVAQPTAVGIIKRMEHKKLVEAFQNPDDRRVKMIRLTEEGKKKVSFGKKHMKKTEELIMAPLSEEERDWFCNCLRRVRDSLKTV